MLKRIWIMTPQIRSYLENQRILVTGACGTVGRELIRLLLEEFAVGELVGLDNNESELFFLEQHFSQYPNASFYLADVRDAPKLTRKMQGVDTVFHTAALKHVIICEKSPFDTVQTNIMGVQNVIQAAAKNEVGQVIFTSSDKAVNPTSVMGTSKLMGERLMSAANSNLKSGKTRFSSTRFGNVLGSRGSVIPIFREQIRRGGPVTVTDAEMTRFIMSISDAVRLVIESAFIAKGGEVFITKMPVIRIQDLAEVMVETLAPRFGHSAKDIEIMFIGTKPGEKIYEELMNSEETRRVLELENYYVVYPAFGCIPSDTEYDYQNRLGFSIDRPYNSSNQRPLSKTELTKYLWQNGLLDPLDETPTHPAERHWPDTACLAN